ncbi:MAG: outer membrane beta-barrel protein [Coraliomargaritaceae bacterium]
MNSHKLLLSSLSFGVVFTSGLFASPFASIGDIADVYFTGSSSARWTSNVFRDEVDEMEDLIVTVTPGVEVNIGRGLSNLDLTFISSYDFATYTENDDLDVEMFHFRGLAAYRSSRWDVNGSFSFDEQQSATGEANVVSDLIETEDLKAKINGEYRYSPKFSFGSGFAYETKDYIEPANQFANYDNTSLPFDLFYKWTPKLDLSFGYKYAIREVDSYDRVPNDPANGLVEGYETKSHFYNMGVRGVILPKLTGYFKVGYSTRDSDSSNGVNRGKTGTLGLDADLSWAATQKLTNYFKLSRDFGVSGEGNVTEVTTFNASSRYLLNTYWSINPNLGYTLRSYKDSRGREDKQYSAGVNANYLLNQYWSFTGGYNYSENDSSESGNSFTDHLFTVSASLRY